MAIILQSYTRQNDTIDTTTMKRARKKKWKKKKCRLGTASDEITDGVGSFKYFTILRSTSRSVAVGRPAMKLPWGEGGALTILRSSDNKVFGLSGEA